MHSKLTFSNISAIIILLLSILTFVFGDKIVDNFKKSEIVYSSTKVALKFPSSITIKNNDDQNKALPDSFREIDIVNIGSKPSKDLKVQIVLDGDIVDSSVVSIEDFKKTHKGKSEIFVTMKRLAKNADVKLKIWFKQSTNDLSIKAIDDQGSFKILNINDQEENYHTEIASLILLELFLFLIGYQWFLKPKNGKIISLNLQLQKLEKKLDFVTNERDEFQSHFEDITAEKEPDVMTRLKAFIEKEDSDKNRPQKGKTKQEENIVNGDVAGQNIIKTNPENDIEIRQQTVDVEQIKNNVGGDLAGGNIIKKTENE